MENSSRFFANKACEYYPCHSSDEDINCLFCYCPLYHLDCPGSYSLLEKNGKTIKNCTNCTFPHEADNYDLIMALLRADLQSV